MITGSCHCGAVKFEYPDTPEWLTRCNCSVCRRICGLWAYGDVSRIKVHCEPGATIAYVWGDKTLARHICKTCGCTTHWESLDPERRPRMGVNFAMCEPKDIRGLRIRNFDGADSWEYLD